MPLVKLPKKADPLDVSAQQALALKRVSTAISLQISSLLAMYNQVVKLVFDNKLLTPQQVLDAVGPDSAGLMQSLVDIQNLVNSFVPGTIVDPLPDVIPNPDGTATAVAVVKTPGPVK